MNYLALLLLFAYQDSPTFRSEISLVHVDLEVRAQDRPVNGLTKADFRVLDGGKAREIVSFGQDEVPLDVILLFDTSASMRPVVARVAETARAALDQLRAGDRVAVMAFDRSTDLIMDFTEDFAAVEQVIRENVLQRRFMPMSNLQPGLNDAARHFLLQPRSNRRRAILTVTDNQGSRRESEALRNLWEADAVAAGLVVHNVGMPVSYRIMMSLAKAGMKGISERTGGDMVSSDDPSAGFRELLQRLRSRYSLVYTMPQAKPGEERKIRVELTKTTAARHPGATVRARTGYLVPAR